MFAIYGRWSQKVGWHSAEVSNLSFRQPGEVSLTPAPGRGDHLCSSRSCRCSFLAQTLLGAAPSTIGPTWSNFFGLDLARLLPYNLARTWHLQLALFWTAAAFLARRHLPWCRSSAVGSPNARPVGLRIAGRVAVAWCSAR
ncbi:hypothetical protein [Mycobacterium kansasii]